MLSELDVATDEATVLSLEQHVNVTVHSSNNRDLTGSISYTAFRGSKKIAGRFKLQTYVVTWSSMLTQLPVPFLTTPAFELRRNKDASTLFVNVPKSFDVPLEDFLPETAEGMYACAKALKWVIFH